MIEYGRSIRWYNNYEDEVRFSKENGFDFMQIWYKEGELLLEDIEEPKIDTILKTGFPVIIHALLDLNDFDKYVHDLLTILKKLGHNEVIIHPVCDSETINHDTIDKLALKVCDAANLFETEEITLYVENNSKIDPINYTIEDITKMYAQDNNIELLLDIAHIDDYNHLEDIVNTKYPKMLHVADKRFDQQHEHLSIGEGELDFGYIFNKVLNEYQGKLIFEIIDDNEKLIDSLNSIKRIICNK